MQVQAVTKFTGISAQKSRLVLDEMRGRRAEEALAILAYMPQSSAKVVAKTDLYVAEISALGGDLTRLELLRHLSYADVAPMRKWRRFGARGRFKPWKRRSSHVTVVLEDREESAVKAGSK